MWDATNRKMSHFYYLSMLDQLALMFAEDTFGSNIITRYPWVPNMHGHPVNGRWFQRFFLEFEAFASQCPNSDLAVCLAIHLYYDDFGATLKKKCGGLYVSVANTDVQTMHNKEFG